MSCIINDNYVISTCIFDDKIRHVGRFIIDMTEVRQLPTEERFQIADGGALATFVEATQKGFGK
jgi:hypothetical protein